VKGKYSKGKEFRYLGNTNKELKIRIDRLKPRQKQIIIKQNIKSTKIKK